MSVTPFRGLAPDVELATQVDVIDPQPQRGKRKAAVRRIRVHVIDGVDRGLIEEIEGSRLSIGTARDNQIVLTDPTVSRYHLQVNFADGVLVKDLQSRNGTFLSDLQIVEAVVPLGARLRLGHTVLALSSAETPRDLDDIPGIPGLIGLSPAMQEIARSVRKLAESGASVLVQGETGTGKELIARAIHQLGPRSKGPFVVVDSGALSPTLIASQLFGHERGAFTGADCRREGAFELAHGGTLFLDEVGDLPPSIQPALLGVLERRSFRRLGGKETIQVDVRVISATHRDLRAEGRGDDPQSETAGDKSEAAFRMDLYYRLAVGRLAIPPLRDRPEDIEPLVEHFAREISGAPGVPFTPAVMAALRSHGWPGNVRELRNVVESAFATGTVSLDQNGPLISMPDPNAMEACVPYRIARSEAVAAFEQRYVSHLMRSTGGNASGAARVAKMDRPYLLSLLRKHGLRSARPSRYRP